MFLPQTPEKPVAEYFLHTQNPNDSDKHAVLGDRRQGATDRGEPVVTLPTVHTSPATQPRGSRPPAQPCTGSQIQGDGPTEVL